MEDKKIIYIEVDDVELGEVDPDSEEAKQKKQKDVENLLEDEKK